MAATAAMNVGELSARATSSIRLTIVDIIIGIKAHIFPSVIVILSFAVGTAAGVTSLGVITGLTQKQNQLINEFGINVMTIDTSSSVENSSSPQMNRGLLSGLQVTNPGVTFSATKTLSLQTSQNQDITFVEIDSHLPAVRNWKLINGRFIDKHDIDIPARVAVVSSLQALRNNWKPGELLRHNELVLTIVGIVDSATLSVDFQTNTVFVPHSQYTTTSRSASELHRVTRILARTNSNDELEQLVSQSKNFLRGAGIQQFNITTPEKLTRDIKSLKRAISVSAALLTTVLLGFAIFTLATTLINSVRNRFSEIGLRRTIGATRVDIKLIFILEALLLSTVGVIIGIAVVVTLIPVFAENLNLPFQLSIWALITAWFFSIILAFLSALWPATAAARVSPAFTVRL